MTNREVDAILTWAAEAPHDIAPTVVKRASQPVLEAPGPVRPTQSVRLLSVILALIFVAATALVATILGFNGAHVLSQAQGILLFWVMAAMARMAATVESEEMIPGSRSRFDARMVLAASVPAFLIVFPILFHDFRFDRFWSEGLHCLGLGLLTAAGTGFLLWLVVRRGMVLDPGAAGMAVGTHAGLSGLIMLQLHCPILKAPHLMAWHTGVVAVAGIAGYWIGRLAQDFGTKRNAAEFMQ